MDFEQEKKIKDNEKKYHIENLKQVREFSKTLILEMKSLVKSIVLFGSNTHDTLDKDSDIDIMIVLDNVSVYVSDELREAYRIITNNLSNKENKKFHIMTVNFSDFWDMARKGDPVLINVLRYGLPIYDTNLVEPMQYLLESGKIKPSRETVVNYMARSTMLLDDTKKHLNDAVMDLYYSVVDIVHSSLILEKIMPPSPKEMPEIFKNTFKNKSLGKYSKTIEELYKVAKDIEHKSSKKITGKYYDELEAKTEELVLNLKKHIENELLKKDQFDL
jgi:predicted nucleotidyltransferase